MRQGGERPQNSRDRRIQKKWLLLVFGDGTTCPCQYCQATLTFETLTKDRVLPGNLGGDYKRHNLVPACQRCNSQRSDNPKWRGPNPRRDNPVKRNPELTRVQISF